MGFITIIAHDLGEFGSLFPSILQANTSFVGGLDEEIVG